ATVCRGSHTSRLGLSFPAAGCPCRPLGSPIRGTLPRILADALVRPPQRPAAAHLARVPVCAQAAAGDRRLRRALALPGAPAADDGGRPRAVPPSRRWGGAAAPPPRPRQDGSARRLRLPGPTGGGSLMSGHAQLKGSSVGSDQTVQDR